MSEKLPYTIFYADDDQDDLDFFMEVTDDLGQDIAVVTHSSGEEVLHALHNPPPQPVILFLDLNMPGLTGFDVLKELRSNRDFDKLPVVVFSTSSDRETINKSKELGANFYVSKSAHFPTLKKSIAHTLHIDWESFQPNAENFVYAS